MKIADIIAFGDENQAMQAMAQGRETGGRGPPVRQV